VYTVVQWRDGPCQLLHDYDGDDDDDDDRDMSGADVRGGQISSILTIARREREREKFCAGRQTGRCRKPTDVRRLSASQLRHGKHVR